MWMTRAGALIVSGGVHAVFVWSMWGEPVKRVEVVRVPIEMELRPFVRPVEARRTPVVEQRKASSRRRGPVVLAAPAPVALAVAVAVAEVGEVQVGRQPGGDDDADVGGEEGPPAAPPDSPAELLVMPRITYPETARADDVEGVVRLWVKLDERGQVISVEVLEEPGSGLGAAARSALMRAQFRPATHLGAAVQSGFEYVYRFRLL
ncbi:MAG: energy transducer TonB [Archangium sp.]|nr:energy transducer TonB [Archangium sp.]MDP3575312.1 energy transducer TonB [Archangium sp.]